MKKSQPAANTKTARILDLLRRAPMSSKELTEQFGGPIKNIAAFLNPMVARGLIERVQIGAGEGCSRFVYRAAVTEEDTPTAEDFGDPSLLARRLNADVQDIVAEAA